METTQNPTAQNRLKPEHLEAIPVALFTADAQGKVTYWNRRMEEITGRPASEVLGRKAWSAFFEKRKQTPVELALRSEEEEVEEDFVLCPADGEEPRSFRFLAVPILDEAEEPVGVIATLVEAGHGARAGDASEARRRAELLDLVPTPVVAVDRQLNVTFMNPAGAAIVGESVESCLGRKCYDLFKTTHCRTAECRVVQAMERGAVATGETVSRGAGGLAIRYTATPLRDHQGNVVGALEYVADISALRSALDETALKVEYLNNIPTPVMAVDKEFTVQFVNPAGATALGKSAEACVGMKCFQLFKTSHCNTGDCAVGKAMRLGEPCTNDTIARLPGGDKPIRYTGSPLRDGRGQIVGAIEYVVDITEENRAVAEVESLVKAFVEGSLSARGNPEAYRIVGFRNVLDGINRSIDALLAPVTEAVRVLQRLASRDLSARITSSFSGDHALLRDATNGTAEALDDALQQVAQAAEQVSSASGQIAAGAQAVAQGASEQASSIEETSSNLEEMASMTRQNASSATKANELAREMRASADTGNVAMQQMLAAMTKIREAAQSTSQIIRDINEISFQTNLLALNAAVEAARAGDAGRGFAVVAEEVRNLAQRSKEAAGKTEVLINESVKLSGDGEQITRNVSSNLESIVSSVARVSLLVEEITTSSQEQARGLEQLNQAVAQMDQVVQQNVTNAEESSSASEELASQAEQLASMVGSFQLTREVRRAPERRAERGGNGHARPPMAHGHLLRSDFKDF